VLERRGVLGEGALFYGKHEETAWQNYFSAKTFVSVAKGPYFFVSFMSIIEVI
jgi:hypothetical protein